MFSFYRNYSAISGKLSNVNISAEIAKCSDRNSIDLFLFPAFSGMRKVLKKGW